MKRSRFVVSMVFVTIGAMDAQQSGTGVGLVFGDPTGLTVKHWLSGSTALQGTVGTSPGSLGGDLFVAGDYLWNGSAPLASNARIPYSYGLGAFVTHSFGIRGTFGISLFFRSIPVEVFLQMHPAISLTPSTDFGLQGGLGFRWFFR